jgi:U3 small nucleolar RNA-associated protein 19
MPSTVSSDAPLKRKRDKVPEKASKRAKAESSDSEDENDRQAEILLLEDEILQSKKNYNNIAVLLELAKKQDDLDVALFATVSLCRVFLRLMASGSLSRKPGQSERETVVIQWLKGRLSDYKKLLVAQLGQEPSASTALTLSMRLLKTETQVTNKKEVAFPRDFLKEIIGAIVRTGFEDVESEFCEKYMAVYADVRFYAFKLIRYCFLTRVSC